MTSAIQWKQTCCGRHGAYAEHPMNDGGVARLTRGPDIDGILVCRIGADNVPIDVDAQGVPTNVLMTEAEALALLA